MPRKIRDRRDALACLKAVEDSAMELAPWARAHGIDARSLNCWRRNLRWQPGNPHLFELLPTAPARETPPVARYTLRIEGVELEVDDHFREETLARLLDLVAGC